MATKVSEYYHCPRCGNKKIIEYEESIDCPQCFLEFEKSDLQEFDDENILSIEEKLDFLDTFKELKEIK